MLAPYFVRKSLDRLTLSDSNRQHLAKLLGLVEADHRANVARIHEALFSLNTTASANNALYRLITTVNEAADKQGVPLEMKVSNDKKVGASGRWVWFEGPIEAPAPAHTSELNAIPPGQLITDQRGLPTGEMPVVVLITFNKHETASVLHYFHPQSQPPNETRDGITYNLLGLHGGMRIVHRISKQGEGEAQSAAHDAIKDWSPRAIIGVGIAFGVNPGKQKIGDVLVSAGVRDYELSRVNADTTVTLRSLNPPASPVLYQRINHLDQTCQANPDACTHWPTLHFGTLLSGNKLVDNLDYRNDLLKLETEAIGGEMEAIGIQLASDRHKVDWIIVKAICDFADGNKDNENKEADQKLAADHAALVVQRALALGNLYANISTNAPSPRQLRTERSGPKAPTVSQMNLRDRDAIPEQQLIRDAQGRHATLKKDGDPAPVEQDASGVDVMDYLLQWVDQPQAPPLFALLGEYGMGKTVTCQRLAEALETRRTEDPGQVLPLYFDLRHVTGLDKRVPTLKEVLEECMARGWLADGDGESYLLANVYRWIEQGAVVIFDGLDEVLVKLREADGQVFTKELLKLHAVDNARRRADGRNTPPLKLLISCRTQYFRTLREQQNHFTGQERGEHQAESYRALVLLPFNDKQVMRYLAAALPGSDPQRLLDTLQSVHNLEELSQRPYTLKLVAEFIPAIEDERMAGKTVYGVTLYRRMAQRWLERDDGKHHIRPEHKMHLAAHLAAYLWRTGSGQLPAGEIERWFHAWIDSETDLKRRYAGLHPDQLEEDLRTATFLARRDSGQGSSFRFAHTSLLEFFLADYLLHAVQDDAPERWAMQKPSDETLDFLGQMLAESGDAGLLQTLQAWRKPYRAEVSEMLLAYALLARRKGWPVPVLRGIQMSGAKLRGWVFDGRMEAAANGATALDLSEADFSGADLCEAVFDHVRLEHASFRLARLVQANFLDCDATNSDWRGSECTAAIWRAAKLSGATWAQAGGYRPQFIFCAGAPDAEAVHSFSQPQQAPLPDKLASTLTGAQTALRWLSGHQGWVNACAFSPDGARLASAGFDGSVRLWDAASGAALLTLSGHEGWVNACAFSPDGARLASAGDDGSVRLWDAASGAAVLTLRGHEGEVNACAFSPDGTRLASAGDDGSVRLWDAASGAAVLTLRGHEGGVRACAFSPDGARLASAGDDGSVRLWDAASGAALLTLRGHEGGVRACAFSPDGARLASAGFDGSVRLWDAASGEQLRIHAVSSRQGHAVWMPQENRLIEACGDAWRWLAWVQRGDDGWPQRLPLETFGPMPAPQRLRAAASVRTQN